MRLITLYLFVIAIGLNCFAWDDETATKALAVLQEQGAPAAIAFADKHEISPYSLGNRLLRSGDIAGAKHWFESLADQTDEAQYRYGLAYAQWVSGNHAVALKDAHFLLASEPPPKIRARTYYLTSQIHLAAYDLEAAEQDSLSSLAIYQSLDGMAGGEYLNHMILANVRLNRGEYDAAQSHLDAAIEANGRLQALGKKPYSLGAYYDLLGSLNLAQGNYFQALTMTRQSYDAFVNNGNRLLAEQAEAKTALLFLLAGNPEKAYKMAHTIWERTSHDDHRAYVRALNDITLMKLSQCNNHEADATSRKRATLAWANANPGGRMLKKLLQTIENTPCPDLTAHHH
ncbi:hypothetical protein SCOR_01895 [Sulfidibacter corallicola]|uniref:Tetratricopeptide repeat-containing protein n=1 Tax=Sulfidibacter corallicola TaxID=2818388 RepID=A0A8A4THT4_SULCO|nr:hypothetical protein [Sulfidibacter corallicola]QTD48722.1 hypothetical protein J3U87_24340 [Sulfidibacter corallicola]